MKLRPVWRSSISPINLHLMRQPVKKRKKKISTDEKIWNILSDLIHIAKSFAKYFGITQIFEPFVTQERKLKESFSFKKKCPPKNALRFVCIKYERSTNYFHSHFVYFLSEPHFHLMCHASFLLLFINIFHSVVCI